MISSVKRDNGRDLTYFLPAGNEHDNAIFHHLLREDHIVATKITFFLSSILSIVNLPLKALSVAKYSLFKCHDANLFTSFHK